MVFGSNIGNMGSYEFLKEIQKCNTKDEIEDFINSKYLIVVDAGIFCDDEVNVNIRFNDKPIIDNLKDDISDLIFSLKNDKYYAETKIVVFLNSKECDELRMKHSTDIFEKYGITAEDVKEFRNEMFYDDLIQKTSETFKEMKKTGKENISKMEANEKIEDIVNETSNSKQYETMDKEDKENIISEYQEKMENIFNIFTEEVEGYKKINIEKFNNDFKDNFERMRNEDKERINEIKDIFKDEKTKNKEKGNSYEPEI